MDKVIIGIGSIILLIWLMCAVVDSMSKTERIECERWQIEANTLTAWYSTTWQKEQCNTYGIAL